jgi:hypothetical protein
MLVVYVAGGKRYKFRNIGDPGEANAVIAAIQSLT